MDRLGYGHQSWDGMGGAVGLRIKIGRVPFPIGSIYVFFYIYQRINLNVGKFSIHGASGFARVFSKKAAPEEGEKTRQAKMNRSNLVGIVCFSG